jgi:hypothetical protein
MPVDEYLKLRRKVNYDAKTTYAQVAADPITHQGKIIEISGTVGGSIRREASISFMLSMEGGQSVFLTAPASDTPMVADVNRQRLRALVKVASSTTSNVAPVEVLALAHDADVTLREQQAAEKEKAAAKDATQTRPASRTINPQPSRGGGYTARVTSGAKYGLSDLAQRYLAPDAQSIYGVYRQFIQNHNKRLTPEQADAITVAILHFSPRFKVDPRLVIALIIAESDFNLRSFSSAGAMGLGQLMPDEVKSLKIPDPYDPVWNIRGAVDLLKGKLDVYKRWAMPNGELSWRQIELALAAYNAGSGAVRKYGYNVPPYKETQRYVVKVTGLYKQLLGYRQ